MEHDEYVEYLVSIGHDRATAQTMANAYAGPKADGGQEASATASNKRTMTRQERTGSAVAGLFLMCFGAPFVVLPGMMWFDINGSFDPVVLCFTSPFIFAGGLVIAMGGNLLLSSIRGVQGMVWIEDGDEGETQAVGEGTAETSRTSNGETDPYASSAYPSMEDLIDGAGNEGSDLAGAVEVPHVSPPQTEDGADVGTGAFWGNLSAADDEN